MKRFLLAFSAVCALAGGATCLRVIHDTNTVIIVPDFAMTPPDLSMPPPDLTPDIHAQALYVVNLARASGNLAPAYSAIILGLHAALAERHVFVDEWAVVPDNGPPGRSPDFVYGGSNSLLAPDAEPLAVALAKAAATGNYDPAPVGAAEQANLADIALRLKTATLPPELNHGSSQPAFSSPQDIFLVVTVQPVRRHCALDDPNCKLGGKDPLSYFTALSQFQTAAWLNTVGAGARPKSIRHLFIATSEGESPADFASRCSGVPGFPRTLLDVMEPSPVAYYEPLTTALNAAGTEAYRVDLCELLGSSGKPLLVSQALRLGHR